MKKNKVKVKLSIIETYEVPRVIEVEMTPQQYKNYENGECELDRILRDSKKVLDIIHKSKDLSQEKKGFCNLKASDFNKDIKYSRCKNMDILYGEAKEEEI